MKRRMLWLVVCVAIMVSLLAMPVNAMASSKARMMKTNARANLRDPENYKHIIGDVKKNKEVYFTGKSIKSFYLVKTKSGKLGYIFKLYLDETNSSSAKKSVYRAKRNTKIYKKPSTSSKSVTSLISGQYVQVGQTKDGWAYVMNTKGKKGYVRTSDLSK